MAGNLPGDRTPATNAKAVRHAYQTGHYNRADGALLPSLCQITASRTLDTSNGLCIPNILDVVIGLVVNSEGSQATKSRILLSQSDGQTDYSPYAKLFEKRKWRGPKPEQPSCP